MLPVERGNDLSRVKIGERDDLHFGKAERRFDGARHAAHFALVRGAAQNGRDLDDDLGASSLAYDQLRDRAFNERLRDVNSRNPLFYSRLNPLHGLVYCPKGVLATGDRQIGEIDIDGQARQVADKQVDRRAALEGKALLLCDEGIVRSSSAT